MDPVREYAPEEMYGQICKGVQNGKGIDLPLGRIDVAGDSSNRRLLDDYLSWFHTWGKGNPGNRPRPPRRHHAMKPLRNDRRHRLRITGDELAELQRHTAAMAEAFGLDRKIDAYKGTRPLTLYRWDLECLLDVIAFALVDPRDYPDHSAPGYLALRSLGERLRAEYDAAYGDE